MLSVAKMKKAKEIRDRSLKNKLNTHLDNSDQKEEREQKKKKKRIPKLATQPHHIRIHLPQCACDTTLQEKEIPNLVASERATRDFLGLKQAFKPLIISSHFS